jgi:serine/threonine protein kinase
LIFIPNVSTTVIENEVNAILKLFENGTHPNIVTVLKIGDITPFLFIDMELCDLNLDDYIYCKKDPSTVPINFIKDRPPPLKSQQIWNVMLHVGKGVEFLHGKRMVHRDLKPLNSTSFLIGAHASFIFAERRDVEAC